MENSSASSTAIARGKSGMRGDNTTFRCLAFNILAGFHLEMPTGSAHSDIISSCEKKSSRMQFQGFLKLFHSHTFEAERPQREKPYRKTIENSWGGWWGDLHKKPMVLIMALHSTQNIYLVVLTANR